MSTVKTVKAEPLLNRDPYSIPLDQFDLTQPALYSTDTVWPFLDRLRKEDPVNYCSNSLFGPYWSVMSYKHIMEVESNHDVYSSEPTVSIPDIPDDVPIEMFISMDEPRHGEQRKVVQPVVAPTNLALMEPIIRERICGILDALPVNETFDWVDKVSIELTTQMLATLFDFPFEDRRKLTFWSDAASAIPKPGAVVETRKEQMDAMMDCLTTFTEIWNERAAAKVPGNDLISMLVNGEATRNMEPMQYLGNLLLLIIGGNDTTRNSLSGGVVMLNDNPGEYQKLRNNPSLIPKMIPEIIRYQTPIISMRRTATQDTVLGGKQIKAGEKVILWYVSGNRDEAAIERPYDFIIDRAKPRQHLSFGFGIHRCMGNRLAEMQLRVTWEEIMKRFEKVEVVGEPVRGYSSQIRTYTELPVQLRPLKK
ncbi:MAG: cytochrome P450 [Pseudomonadales bacterium]|nr:cytochrome P450 [Pseudomonadales bacterium]